MILTKSGGILGPIASVLGIIMDYHRPVWYF